MCSLNFSDRVSDEVGAVERWRNAAVAGTRAARRHMSCASPRKRRTFAAFHPSGGHFQQTTHTVGEIARFEYEIARFEYVCIQSCPTQRVPTGRF